MACLQGDLEGRGLSYLIYLIPLSIALGLLGVAAFIWALRNDQFDDPEGNAARVLLNDTPPQPKRTDR